MEKTAKLSQEINTFLDKELLRQEETISLIPSENYVSQTVLDLIGSALTNKYAEGYPKKRYYPGNAVIDKIELYCQKKAKEIFGLDKNWQANVQPYSGSPANLAIYFGLLAPGDKILSLKLSHGGHLSHGHKVNISSHFYQIIHYSLDNNGFIDYSKIEELAFREKPALIVSGATAYPRKIDFKQIGQIAKKIKAYHLADISHIAGLVAAGLHPSPFEWADTVMTTTHKTLRGPRSAVIYSRKEIAAKIDKAVFPGLQGGPHENIILAKAAAFEEALKPEFKIYQRQIIKNAKALADYLAKEGFNLVSGGTDNHLILMDLSRLIDAAEAEKLLEKSNILANRNTIPGDKSPFKPSGLRLGTPAVTTRGMKEKELVLIAGWIKDILRKNANPAVIRQKVINLCQKFPLNYS